jgi:integrase
MGITALPSGRFRLQIRRASLRVDEVYATRSAAEAALRRYTVKVARREAARAKDGPTLTAVWSLYRESRDFLEKRPNTQRCELSHIKPALAFLGDRPLRAITADDIDAFIVHERKAKKAPDTIRNSVAALSAVLNYGRAKAIVPNNAALGVKRPGAVRTARRMPQAHLGALMAALAHPRYRYRAAARLALLVRETGARPGEWATAKWDDLDLSNNKVVFSETKYRRQPRTVPLTTAAMALLTAQWEDAVLGQADTLGGSEYVFPVRGRDDQVRPFAYSGTLRDMKGEGVLPKGLRAHTGRHEYISSLVENTDLDDSRIMSLVGHHSPASMQIYTHARNVRFLPQLEALEESRRKERARALATALGVPVAVIESYLAHRRDRAAADGLDDAGEELLYDAASVEELRCMAEKLGKSESERLRSLLQIQRMAAAKKASRRPQQAATAATPLPKKNG